VSARAWPELGRPALLALLAAVVATWPAVLRVGTHLHGDPWFSDTQVGLWWGWHVPRALLRLQDPFVAQELVWPEGQDVTLLVWNLGAQLLSAPFFLLLAPVAALNASAFLTQALNGVACAWAVRALGGDAHGQSLAAGLAGASAYAWIEAGHGRFEQAMWFPLPVFLGALLTARPRLAGVALGVAGALYWFHAYFLVLVCVVWWAFAPRARLRAALEVGCAALAVALPFLLRVAWAALGPAVEAGAVAQSGGDGLRMQAAAVSAFPVDWLWPIADRPLQYAARLPLFLLPAGVWALWRGTGAVRALGACALACAVLSAGPWAAAGNGVLHRPGGHAVPLPMLLLDVLPGFRRFWWCYRWLGLAIPAAIVTLGTLRLRAPVVAVAGLLACVETAALLRGGPSFASPALREVVVPRALAVLARLPDSAPIVQLPTDGLLNANVGAIPFHGQPIDGGIVYQIPQARSSAWRARAGSSPLWQALRGGPPRRMFSASDTGGFRYVLLWKSDRDAQRVRALDASLRQSFGPPAAEDATLSLWAIPGSGSRPAVEGR
jgi:hypothetical protein